MTPDTFVYQVAFGFVLAWLAFWGCVIWGLADV